MADATPHAGLATGQTPLAAGLAIQGIGTALPPHVMHQGEAADLAARVICQSPQQATLLRALYRRAGVQQRYTAVPFERALQWRPDAGSPATQGPTTGERMEVYRQQAPPLAVEASAAALRSAGIDARQITHLLTVSCTGFHAPGIDWELMDRLPLPPTVQRLHLGFMGCHGAINALRAALAMARAEPDARVLVCCVELCSLHYQFAWNPEHMVGNALFGDGAAAVVGSAAAAGTWRVAATGSYLLPECRDAMSWSVGDYGFLMELSAAVPEIIEMRLRPWLELWLAEHGVRLAEIGSWAIHPGGPRIITAVERALGLDESATSISRDVLREYGNLSSPTVLFILQRLMECRAARPCVMLAFGPGLTVEAALLI